MKEFKALMQALSETPFFITASWDYVVTDHFDSKVDYFLGVVPAWCRYMRLQYNHYRSI